jgi:hypothetical protein
VLDDAIVKANWSAAAHRLMIAKDEEETYIN